MPPSLAARTVSVDTATAAAAAAALNGVAAGDDSVARRLGETRPAARQTQGAGCTPELRRVRLESESSQAARLARLRWLVAGCAGSGGLAVGRYFCEAADGRAGRRTGSRRWLGLGSAARARTS